MQPSSCLLNIINDFLRMLFDFHQTQNSRKPGTVHATYLLDGVSLPSYELTVNGTQSDGEDVHMRSSPYMSSSMPQEGHDEKRIPTRKVMLAREEDLEGKDKNIAHAVI